MKEDVIKYGCEMEWHGVTLRALDYPTLKKMLKSVNEYFDEINLDVMHTFFGPTIDEQ